MARAKATAVNLDFAFYEFLIKYYSENRAAIKKQYRPETRKILDFNNPENKNVFLRTPQYEALEMYVFLKEYLGNRALHEIFDEWYHKKGVFKERSEHGVRTLFGSLPEETYREIFEKIKASSPSFANYIFALTMGTGKTILMATCIFYEFILAEKYPEDKRYCHNALVFAPDKTVLQSLHEIKTFDKSKVVPLRWVNWLNANLQFHYLDDSGATLSLIDRSKYNIIISNTQKIILKQRRSEMTSLDKLFRATPIFEKGSLLEKYKDLYDIDDEAGLIGNQRFTKLTRIAQLGVYVDEAHHAFGNALEKELTSLRKTILMLDERLGQADTHVVACFNYTGTPYVGSEVLPEVVYAYSLNDAIRNKYLKQVEVHSYAQTKDLTFVRAALGDFWKRHKGKRYEGKLPKIAFFASTIEELQQELQPRVEKIMEELGIPAKKLLINVGDESITSNDDLREFNKLDDESSNKQVILLVNKGKEGWNCRSLFSVALFREPRSKVFVLQATMRCMRAIGSLQEMATVYLTEECRQILAKELDANFRMTIEELGSINTEKQTYQVRPLKDVTINLKRIRTLYGISEKPVTKKINFGLEELDLTCFKSTHSVSRITDIRHISQSEEIDNLDEKRVFSLFSMTAEIARYLNRRCLEIEHILQNSKESVEDILKITNKYNAVLYDIIIPRIFNLLYDIREHTSHQDETITLIKDPPEGYYEVQAKPSLVATAESSNYKSYKSKSFHVDTYCFDSGPEKTYFDRKLRDKGINNIWYTGMFKHGQSDFFIQYIDPESHALRSYYPDFLIREPSGSYEIVEVKGDNKIYDPVVMAKKDAAEQVAEANKMKYVMLRSSDLSKVSDEVLSTRPLLDFVDRYTFRMFKDLLPVYSLRAACEKFGNGQDVECDGWVEVTGRKLDENMFIVQAVGKSMEPEIPEYSYCIFRFNPSGLRQNKIVLFQHLGIGDPETGGEYTIKKFSSQKISHQDDSWQYRQITLSPLNPDYKPIVIESGRHEESEGFRVIGEFVDILKM